MAELNIRFKQKQCLYTLTCPKYNVKLIDEICTIYILKKSLKITEKMELNFPEITIREVPKYEYYLSFHTCQK